MELSAKILPASVCDEEFLELRATVNRELRWTSEDYKLRKDARASAAIMASTMCLRAAVHQLSTTPTQELPFVTPFLASTLSDCGAVLSAPETKKASASGNEDSLLVQKLKARITSLLQDRTVEGRWTAVVLVKSIVEAGQWEILRGCESWVRGLLGVLGVSADAKWELFESRTLSQGDTIN